MRYFVAVAEEENITRAAKRRHLSQPALSRQMKALEDEAGAPLFLRHANAVTLTPEGKLLLGHAREILARSDVALAAVRAAAGISELRVAYSTTLANELIAATIRRLARTHPAVRVRLIDISTAEMYRGLLNGSLDIIVTISSGLDRDIRWNRLRQVGIRALIPRRHALAKLPAISPSALAAEPWLIFSRKDYPEFWQGIQPWVRSRKLKPRLAGEYDGINTLATAVAAGLGVGLVNDFFKPSAGFVTRPLASPPPPSWIAVGTSGRLRPSVRVKAFLAAIAEAAFVPT